jgi:hypothetical protein
MVKCSLCNVNPVDRHCTNAAQSCYTCCTSHPTIPTCPGHYAQMGITAAAARHAAGLVHIPASSASEAAGTEPAAAQHHSAPPGGSNVAADDAGPNSSASQQRLAPAQADEQNRSDPAPAAVAATATSIAALRAQLEADKAAAEVTVAALQAQLSRQAADVQQILSLLRNPQPAAAASPPPHTPPSPPLQPPPVPHRSAVLDRTTSSRDLSNLVAAVVNADPSDSEEQEVTSHTHTTTRTTVLPPAFVPTTPGTEQSAQQQLAAIVSGLSKQGAKVKSATVADFNEALDDWATDSAKAGWTVQQVEAIRTYQRLLILKFLVAERRPFVQVLEYHRKWCKALYAGSIDMFAPGAELNLAILYDVEHPLTLGHTAASTTAAGSPKTRRSTGAAAAAATSTARTSPNAGRHAAGSCVNHPASTTHTTAECNASKK